MLGSIQQTFTKKNYIALFDFNFFPKNSTKGMPLIQSINEDNMPFFQSKLRKRHKTKHIM